jgi:hypothetical protein
MVQNLMPAPTHRIAIAPLLHLVKIAATRHSTKSIDSRQIGTTSHPLQPLMNFDFDLFSLKLSIIMEESI